MWEKLNKVLKQILDDNNLLSNTYSYEASELTGTPVATLTPSANEGDYATTTENDRIYAFLIRLFYRRDSGASNEHDTEAAMRELVDTVLDDLDKNHQLTDLETQAGYCFLFMEASPSVWLYAGRDNEYRLSEILVRVHFRVDTTTIS